MDLTEAPEASIRAEIKKFQRAQRQASADGATELFDRIGSMMLAPLFAEMARRGAK